MPHRQQQIEDMALLDQRIAEGESYLERMRALRGRSLARGEDLSDVDKVIADMETTQTGFLQKRDELARLIQQSDRA